MERFTMVARHKSGIETVGFTLISSKYQTIQVSKAELLKKIASKQIVVTNLDISEKDIVSTNGAMDRYTVIEDANIYSLGGHVVLDRIERDNKLVAYTIFSNKGKLSVVKVEDAVKLANDKLICNGKIRHTDNGDIVQSIKGEYPIREIDVQKAPKGKLDVAILYFGATLLSKERYVAALISTASAAEFSKIQEKVDKANKKLVSKITSIDKLESDVKKDVISNVRVNVTSVYAVIDFETLKSIIKENADTYKVQSAGDNDKVYTVSVVGNGDEAVANVDIEDGTVKVTANIEKLDKKDAEEIKKMAKVYGEKVLKEMKELIK